MVVYAVVEDAHYFPLGDSLKVFIRVAVGHSVDASNTGARRVDSPASKSTSSSSIESTGDTSPKRRVTRGR